jgi:hypothetical protein
VAQGDSFFFPRWGGFLHDFFPKISASVFGPRLLFELT